MSAEVEENTADAVVVAYIHQRTVESSWFHCMNEMVAWDALHDQRVMRGGYISMTAETDGLSRARNRVVEIFLEENRADWLFWIDTDMGFAPNTIDQLMESADSVECPIVGALAFTWRQERPDGMGGWRHRATPTIFDWGQDGTQEGHMVRWDYHRDAVQQCSATGSACVLIHRSVLEKVAEKYGEHWYDRFYNKTMDRLTSEDISFCMRAASVGCTTWVDSSVKTTHAKTVYVSETDHFSQRALAQLMPVVPEATERTAILVPALKRPQNAVPFMDSLLASRQPLAQVYAICDKNDLGTADAWLDAGAEVLIYEPEDEGSGTFAQKVNFGYDLTDEPWLFLVGDDVRFHPNWLDHAQHASRDGAQVIGTNDLKNPRVVKGDHATHLLIRRSYVDERGASLDGPKVVCHEGYGHWYVDDEIVTVAKAREVWAFAQHSKVEHLHPIWGGAEMDETYELGKSRAPADKELFEARMVEIREMSRA
jgi:hypothetical protein